MKCALQHKVPVQGGFSGHAVRTILFLIPVRVISLLMQNKMRAKVLLVT